MRSAPQSRLCFAISLINAMISPVTFGLFEVAFVLCFQKRRKLRRCHRKRVVFLDDQERLSPGPRRSCQKHQEASILLGAYWSFALSTKNDELLA
jgi:hypothetical protein